jgi:hypothetical protein
VVHLRGAPILSILVLEYLLPNAAVRYVVFGIVLGLVTPVAPLRW